MENIIFKQSILCQPCREVISLTQMAPFSWEELSAKAPLLPRGWFELSRLSSSDRMEFTFLFWRSRWEVASPLEEGIARFFDELEEIELFLVQNVEGGSYLPLMLYLLKKGKGFFFGSLPGEPQAIARLRAQFSDFPLPEDYLSFLSIHDGFGRGTEGGLIKMRDFAGNTSRFQERLSKKEFSKELLESTLIVPFYEFESVHCWQCFYRTKEGMDQMKNCYFNELLYDGREPSFPSFSEWLLSYVYSK